MIETIVDTVLDIIGDVIYRGVSLVFGRSEAPATRDSVEPCE